MGPEEKVSATEELPYFAEKYPGKLCCLCNLGERSSLGQGDFLRIVINTSNIDAVLDNEDDNEFVDNVFTVDELAQIAFRRSKASKLKALQNVVELDRIGHDEPISLTTLCEPSNSNQLEGMFIYIHRMCAMWSRGITRNNDDTFQNVEPVVAKSLNRRCSFCGAFGASLTCRMSCKKAYHFPCSASGCLLIISNFTVFCMDHISQAHLLCADANILCRQCSDMGDISKLVMCSTCGDHYHTTCIGLANQPDTKSGWNCTQCSKCQICRQSDINEARSVKCEQCQKVYHANCFRPIISSIPKYGWKCNRCRVCSDCGSRTPGAGASSRWHCHYTICDSCYQQRNKGFSCPICHRAYRAAAHKEMVKCSSCNRFVHSTCDSEADLSNYHSKKDINPDYDYVCPHCKMLAPNEKSLCSNSLMRSFSDIETSSVASSSMADSIKDMDIDCLERGFDESAFLDDNQKNYRKRLALKDIARRGGKVAITKANMLTQFGRKRARGKNRHMLMYGNVGGGVSANAGDRNNRSTDEDLAVDKKLVLCSAKDKFILSQDLCVMCGAVGVDSEGCLIACSQCGQCYHPYCVNIKISKVILEKGWRCLDCTVCEGCGQKNDESRLLLCDECDISYHIYCMNPPLDTVPNGNWKCKWCAICQKCGRQCSGKNPQWRNGSLECGPCASQSFCCICTHEYAENDLIIQCGSCDRWLHCHCDSIKSEEEAQFCDSIDYQCKLCRPKDKSLSCLVASKTLGKTEGSSNKSINANNTSTTTTTSKTNTSSTSTAGGGGSETSENTESLHWIDGICVTDRGLSSIKSLTVEMKKKRKVRSANDGVLQKDLGILATIESVVAGSSENADGDPLNPMQIYKDGQLWHGHENSAPPGFTVTTNDKGDSILRKKRQRNLQKLGIGGFIVRNRGFKKETDEKVSENTTPLDSSDKKKKAIRKKIKSKLTETYPAYLQEAFFGKEMLVQSSHETSTTLDGCESDSSNDAYKNLDILGCIKIDASVKSSTEKLNDTKLKNQNQINSMMQAKLITDVKSISTTPLVSQTVNETNSIPVELQKDNTAAEKRNNKSNVVNQEIQNFSSLPNTLLFNDDSIQKSNHGTVSNVNNHPKEQIPCGLEGIIKQEPETMTNFGLQQANINNMSSTQAVTTALHLKTVPAMAVPDQMQSSPAASQDQVRQIQQKVLPGQIQSFQSILQQPQTPQTQSPIIIPMQTDIQQNHFAQNSSFLNTQTPTTTTPKNFNFNKNPVVPMQIVQHENTFSSQQILSNDTNRNVFIPARTPEEPMEATVAGTQKTAEKMRRDEELGEMATISAVLYSNTQHPELKEAYPNWNDRCKQILKRWRSLTNEKKAPFLQLAKDNRSALRMRRTHQNVQDQEKTCAQQKTLKEQEQERLWKLHQAKAKEMPPTMPIKTEANTFERSLVDGGEINKNASLTYALNHIQKPVQDNYQTKLNANNLINAGPNSNIGGMPMPTSTLQSSQQIISVKAANADIDIKNQRLKLFRPQPQPQPTGGDKDNKQLRNLLQKQTPTPPTLVPSTKTTIIQPENSTAIYQQQGEQFSFSHVDPKMCFQPRKEDAPTTVLSQNPSSMHGNLVSVRRDQQQQQPMLEQQQQIEFKNRNFIKTNLTPAEQVAPSEFEKLDPDPENAGFGDILGGIADGDDEDLLKSLTAEIGDDFNILEYGDPELDELANNQNFLNRIDFDDGANN